MSAQNTLVNKRRRSAERAARKARAARRIHFGGVAEHGRKAKPDLSVLWTTVLAAIVSTAMAKLARKQQAAPKSKPQDASRPIKGLTVPRRAA
jgi:hypothetical protein